MNNITNAQAYAKFINKTVDTIAQISISTQSEKHFIKHIKAFIKSYQTSEKEFINWIFDGKYHQSNVEDGEKHRQPTTAECLNWYYTLLAIIHDGQKQGNNLYRRIYFNLQEPETAFENTAKTLWFRYAKNPENFPDNFQTTYQLLIEDALRGVNEDLLTASGGKAGANDLTDTEQNILEALGKDTLKGEPLLKKAGYNYSSHYKTILSGLVKRRILEKILSKGYKTK